MRTLPHSDSPGSISPGEGYGVNGAEMPREQRAAALLLSRYNLRLLIRLYATFDGDLLLPIVLGEIAMYNIGGIAADDTASLAARCDSNFKHPPLRPCNAFSISSSTGIPRETVRRKVSHLVLHNWIDRDPKGGLTITDRAMALCVKPGDDENQSDFLATADRIRALLDERQPA